MREQAIKDGDAFLPNPEPGGPADYVLICMEPSLGRWARSAGEASSKVAAGFRNFISSIEAIILHASVRRYLCGPGQRYHITDFSKGAMLVDRAKLARRERYDRWYELLLEEVALVATPTAGIVAVGSTVFEHLKRRDFPRPLSRIIHYSGQAGPARNQGILGREAEFEAFSHSIVLDELIGIAGDVLREARIPEQFCDESLSRLAKNQLTASRKKLMFSYKKAFEDIRSYDPVVPTIEGDETGMQIVS